MFQVYDLFGELLSQDVVCSVALGVHNIANRATMVVLLDRSVSSVIILSSASFETHVAR